jgi:hypothetical protein
MSTEVRVMGAPVVELNAVTSGSERSGAGSMSRWSAMPHLAPRMALNGEAGLVKVPW